MITKKPKTKGFDHVFERLLVKRTTIGDRLTLKKDAVVKIFGVFIVPRTLISKLHSDLYHF